MADRLKEKDSRHVPVSTMNINIPHSFSISTTPKKWQKFKKTFHKTGIRAHSYLKKKFLEEGLGVNDAKDMLNADDEIADAHKKEKDAILNASGLTRNRFSKEINRIIDDRIKEANNEKK